MGGCDVICVCVTSVAAVRLVVPGGAKAGGPRPIEERKGREMQRARQNGARLEQQRQTTAATPTTKETKKPSNNKGKGQAPWNFRFLPFVFASLASSLLRPWAAARATRENGYTYIDFRGGGFFLGCGRCVSPCFPSLVSPPSPSVCVCRDKMCPSFRPSFVLPFLLPLLFLLLLSSCRPSVRIYKNPPPHPNACVSCRAPPSDGCAGEGEKTRGPAARLVPCSAFASCPSPRRHPSPSPPPPRLRLARWTDARATHGGRREEKRQDRPAGRQADRPRAGPFSPRAPRSIHASSPPFPPLSSLLNFLAR